MRNGDARYKDIRARLRTGIDVCVLCSRAGMEMEVR